MYRAPCSWLLARLVLLLFRLLAAVAEDNEDDPDHESHDVHSCGEGASDQRARDSAAWPLQLHPGYRTMAMAMPLWAAAGSVGSDRQEAGGRRST